MLTFAKVIRTAAVNGPCSVSVFAGSSVREQQKISIQTLPRHQDYGCFWLTDSTKSLFIH